jgi:integrase
LEWIAKKPQTLVFIVFFELGLIILYGELIGLMWADIDIKNKVFTVRRTLRQTEGGQKVEFGTKGKRERKIAYDERLDMYISKIPRNGLYMLGREAEGLFTHHTHSSFYKLYYDFLKDLNKKSVYI